MINYQFFPLLQFLFGMSGLVVSEIVCIFLIYTYRQSILDNASLLFQSLMAQYTEDDDVRGLVDKIQSDVMLFSVR